MEEIRTDVSVLEGDEEGGESVREEMRREGESGRGLSAMEFGVENVSLPKKDMCKNS